MDPAVKVPLLDLRAQYASVRDEVDEAVARVHERGNYVMGLELEAFEAEWAAYCDAKYCAGVSSGTDAIYLALQALQELDGPTTVVRVPSATFIGTAEPVIRAGCRLELTDVDSHGIMLRPTPRPAHAAPTSANIVLPVALYGRPVSWVNEATTSDDHDIVITDLAQAHGHQLGWAMIGCFSFYPSKNLGAAGQGGAVVTDDEEIANMVRSLRNHGEGNVRFRHERLSGNYRLDELQAAILRAKLPHLDAWNQRRREIARSYYGRLQGLPGLTMPEDVPGHVYHIFTLRCPRRDDLAAFLGERGIQTAVRYPLTLHQQPALAFLSHKNGDFLNAEAWAAENLSLPIYETMPDEQVEYVAAAVREWAEMQA